MAATVVRLRSLERGYKIEAVQYTLPDKSWQHHNAISHLAAFVLDMDVDERITIENERLLDIIRPIEKEWKPQAGIATVEIIDPTTGHKHKVLLNDWIGRHEGEILVFSPKDMSKYYTPVDKFDELAELVYQHFPWEGETYQAVAERVAGEIIQAGWSREENRKT